MSSTAQAGAALIAERPAAGGPAGGGATQIIMPYLTTAIAKHVPLFEAWRWAFFVPGGMHLLVSLFVMLFATVPQSFPSKPLCPSMHPADLPSLLFAFGGGATAGIHASELPFVHVDIWSKQVSDSPRSGTKIPFPVSAAQLRACYAEPE